MEAEPYPNQSVYINKTAAEVLTVLTDFGFTIAAQSEHSAGNFITWTLVRKEPFLIIRRDYVKHMDGVNNNCEHNESEPILTEILERRTYLKPNPATSGRNEIRSTKSADIPRQEQVMRQVDVQCVAPYKDNSWHNISRTGEGVVLYCQVLRPPAHLASFIKLQGRGTKGITDTDSNTLVFVVTQGEVTVVINSEQFVASQGDTFYVPPHNTYNLLNTKGNFVELFVVQYKSENVIVSN